MKLAYRKTDKVLAHLEERKTLMIKTALDLIARHGAEGLVITDIAAGAGVASGLFYRYFADKDQLLAEAASRTLAADLAAMRIASTQWGDRGAGRAALAGAIRAFYGRLKKPRLVKALADMPAYRAGIRNELARLARGTGMDAGAARLGAAAALGAVYAIYHDEGEAGAAVEFAMGGLRGVAVNAAARGDGRLTTTRQ